MTRHGREHLTLLSSPTPFRHASNPSRSPCCLHRVSLGGFSKWESATFSAPRRSSFSPSKSGTSAIRARPGGEYCICRAPDGGQGRRGGEGRRGGRRAGASAGEAARLLPEVAVVVDDLAELPVALAQGRHLPWHAGGGRGARVRRSTRRARRGTTALGGRAGAAGEARGRVVGHTSLSLSNSMSRRSTASLLLSTSLRWRPVHVRKHRKMPRCPGGAAALLAAPRSETSGIATAANTVGCWACVKTTQCFL